jgi:Mg-chelatase subunit ChlD
MAARGGNDARGGNSALVGNDARGGDNTHYGDALRATITGRAGEDLWDRQVEARAPGATPEQVRRAALAVGWALRADACSIDARDLVREAWMRGVLHSVAGRHAAVVLGAFHIPAMFPAKFPFSSSAAPALEPSDPPLRVSPPAASESDVESASPQASIPVDVVEAALKDASQEAMSLVSYTFSLLDERSGYPAGIRDPLWQQSVYEAGGDAALVRAAAAAHLVAVCRALRSARHPAGPAEAGQALRFALDLAALRGLAAPARGEIVEAVQAVLGQGDSLGRGRALGQAMEVALVGERAGVLAPGTPVSGLRVAVQDLLAELRLPGPGEQLREVRLDPLRSPLDRRREVVLRRLAACHVPYAESRDLVAPGGLAPLTTAWRAGWTPATEAHLNALTVRGLSLAQAAENVLRHELRLQRAEAGPSAAQTLAGLALAAECGVASMLAERARDIDGVVIASASLGELVRAAELADRIRAGHVPGTSAHDVPWDAELSERIDAAALHHLDGLAGSRDPADARSLTAFVLRAAESGSALRADRALRRLEVEGGPMIAAAAGACLVLTGATEPEVLGERVAGWVDVATHRAARSALRERLGGLLAAAGPLLDTGPALLDPLVERVSALSDEDFLGRLPSLRGGFHQVPAAERARILRSVEGRIGEVVRLDGPATAGPGVLADAAAADAAGRSAVLAAGLRVPGIERSARSSERDWSTARRSAPSAAAQGSVLTAADRWRLILAREQDQASAVARRYGAALDELYGSGQTWGDGGAGAPGAPGSSGAGGGRESAFPSVREWSSELEALFGMSVREEVLAQAAAGGRLDAALLIDPASVTPSVELLRNVLSLAGGLPEQSVAKLRPLVARLVEELTKQLARRMRPALHGLTSPRPTSRPGGRLDFDRTVRANLATARRGPDGAVTLLPERPVFRTRARKTADWRLILVVDVSGSMESSVIWSALTAAVFSGISTLQTHFLAFSTSVIDFTDRVADPLSLLLEVHVGGGTHIAAGLAHARSLVTVPSRTLVVTISDFEEGYGVAGLLAQVRALAESGVTLLGCASLDDHGKPRYSVPIAQAVAASGMPVAALSPLELAGWVGERIR